MTESHEHKWIFDHKACCFVLKCIIPGCQRSTSAYHFKGKEPISGNFVQFMDDKETIEVI